MASGERKAAKSRGGKGVILASAIKNFETLGYHGTSMRDIADGADVTVAAIYHHFTSKQEILQDIMVRVLTDVIGKTRNALIEAGPTPADQLVALVGAWIQFHTERQSEALIGASELRSLDTAGKRLVTTLRDEQEEMFQGVIKRGVDMGVFSTRYPREGGRAIIEMGYSISRWYRQDGPLRPSELAERYAYLALGVVRATPTQD